MTENYYTVIIRFDLNGGFSDGLQEYYGVAQGSEFEIPNVYPEKVGCYFIGWLCGATTYYPGDSIEIYGDITLVAQWCQRDSYTVSFDLKGGEGSFPSYTAYCGDELTLPTAIPTRGSDLFVFWRDECRGNSYYPGDTVDSCESSQNLVFTAVWAVTISFDANGSEVGEFPPLSNIEPFPVEIPNEWPYKFGHNFLYWQNSKGDAVYPGDYYGLENGSETLTAVYDEFPKYTVEFNLNEGTGDFPPISQYMFFGFTLSSDIPEKPGYNFNGWYEENNGIFQPGEEYYYNPDNMDGTPKTFTLEAIWMRSAYVMFYEGLPYELVNIGEGGVPESYTITSSIPTKEGHDFVCWENGGNIYTAGDAITPDDDMTFTARWEVQHYDITFDTNGGNGEFPVIDKTYGISINLPSSAPAKEGFVFSHWTDGDGNNYNPSDVFNGEKDTVLTAVWKEILTVTYLDNNGNVLDSTTGLEGDEITVTSDIPEKADYAFLHWAEESENTEYKATDKFILKHSVTFTPVFTKTYILHFVVDNDSYDFEDIEDGKTYITSKTPNKSGYTFFCWKARVSNEYYFPNEEYLGDKDTALDPVWALNGQVVAVYDTGVSSVEIPSDSTTVGGSITLPDEVPTRDGYLFRGWVEVDRIALTYPSSVNEECNLHVYRPGDECVMDVSKRFIALWEKDEALASETHDVDKYGSYNINLRTGTYTVELEDFDWQGARLPVSIKHRWESSLAKMQYTKNRTAGLNTADFSQMKVGLGFKLSIMQSLIKTHFIHPDGNVSDYVYTDENGTEYYFVEDVENSYYENGNLCLVFKEKSGSEMFYDPKTKTLKNGDDEYVFNTLGQLIRICDAFGNTQSINYVQGKIVSVVDGAGRVFTFGYEGDSLASITLPDGTAISYGYDESGRLERITYPSGNCLKLEYANSYDLTYTKVCDSDENVIFARHYYYLGDNLYCFDMHGWEGNAISGGRWILYEFNKNSGTEALLCLEETRNDEEFLHTFYTFNEDGSIKHRFVTAEFEGNPDIITLPDGTVSYSEASITAKNYSNNLLPNHRGESMSGWSVTTADGFSATAEHTDTRDKAKYGQEFFKLLSERVENSDCGFYRSTTLPAGEYTFSAYVRIATAFTAVTNDGAGAYIAVKDSLGDIIAKSEIINENYEIHNRLAISFTLTEVQTVSVWVAVNGEGTAYVDALQLENNPYATAYNMLENGSFERAIESPDWTCLGSIRREALFGLHMSSSMYVNGSSNAARYAYQTVPVKSAQDTRETFTLSGWARGTGSGYENSQYRLRALLNYEDDGIEPAYEEYTADFNPADPEWQYASVQFSKEMFRKVENVTVYCDYDYQSGVAYFDDIELVRDYIETDLTASDFEDSEDDSDTEGNYDVEIEEARDAFGNVITETTHTNSFSEGVIYRSFEYDSTGNNLVAETDARGNRTTYVVDSETSRNSEIIDRVGNRTKFVYDSEGRTVSVTNATPDNVTKAQVSYSYDPLDNVTEILRGDGQKYTLSYDPYRNLKSIGIEGTESPLVEYTRGNNNGRLKEIAYANGDYMKASYNRLGQMISEKWYNIHDTLEYEYVYSYDYEGNIVKTVDKENEREYNYLYDNGNLIRSYEYDISGSVKTKLCEIVYTYNYEGELVKKKFIPAEGHQAVYSYTNGENESTSTLTSLSGSFMTKSLTDTLGRKKTDLINIATTTIGRSFTYYSGEVTDEHRANGLDLGHATTQLVRKITYSNGRTIEYVYDEEERIKGIADSVEGITEYTYDALGQLTQERKNGVTVTFMTYDNYGNILSKNGKSYVYGDGVWRDLLTSFDGRSITYDEQGNPTYYMGKSVVWEKGRQLKSFGSANFKYNANGIRTYKSAGGVTHNYVLDGTKIIRESFGENVIVPFYDTEESVCGLSYNNVSYFFVKNLQGDVIAISDAGGNTVARYSYDAWGKCTITEDTTTVGIASINPYRYRSYYYDTETELYYLQSRYYDPEVGRFINGDEVKMAVRKSTVVGSNLFTYCFNSVTNSRDPLGLDAIWLQATGSVGGLGHTGLIFQYKGNWYYWYWGTDFDITYQDITEAFIVNNTLVIGKSLYTFINAATTHYKLERLNATENLVKKANKLYKNGKFDKSFYIEGNFDKTYNYFKKLTQKKNYHILHNNCMQTTVEGLCRGKFKKHNLLNKIRMKRAKSMTIPNLAYSYLKSFF